MKRIILIVILALALILAGCETKAVILSDGAAQRPNKPYYGHLTYVAPGTKIAFVNIAGNGYGLFYQGYDNNVLILYQFSDNNLLILSRGLTSPIIRHAYYEGKPMVIAFDGFYVVISNIVLDSAETLSFDLEVRIKQ